MESSGCTRGGDRLLSARPGRTKWVWCFASLALLCTALFTSPAAAQLRVVNYNIAALNGNLINLENVLAALHDDDKPGFAVPVGVFVFQEVEQADVMPLRSLLNAAAPPGVTYAQGTYTGSMFEDGNGGAQAMFYRTDMLSETVAAHVDIPTGAGRNTDRWQLRLLGYNSTSAWFYVYGSHLKSDTGTANQQARLDGAIAIRANADALGASAHVIYCGDYNLYNNAEPAYLHFLSAGNGQAFDPLGTGSWAGAANAIKHSQSPRLVSGTLIGGGLDDRFDFQLASAEFADGLGLARITALPSIYRSLGNDGLHYDQAINNGNNFYYPGQLARSNALAFDLHEASDHVPIVVDYQIPAKMAAIIPANYGRVIQNASFTVEVDVTNPANVVHVLGADMLDYTATGAQGFSGVVTDSVDPLGDVSVASFPLDTTIVGPRAGQVNLASTSQGAQPANLVLNTSGTIVRPSNASFSLASDIDQTTLKLEFDANTGAHALEVPMHNFGFDALQALLDVDSVSAVSSPFGFVGGLQSNIGATPATLTFAFDTDKLSDGVYVAQVEIGTSDENLPGETTAMLSLTLNITIGAPTPCPADINGDTFVDVNDLLAVVGAWGATGPNAADINGDRIVNVNDLLAVIGAWGACP